MLERKVNWKFKLLICLIDIFGYVLIKPFLRKTLPEIKKILIIRVDEIGDAILATPVFRALRQKFPNAEISALIKPLNKQVYENNKNINKLILTNSWLKSWTGQKLSIYGFFRLIRQLRRENFDLVVELHTDPRNILLASLVGKFCIGYSYRGFGFLLNKTAKPSNKHITEQCLNVVRLVGADSSDELDLQVQNKAVRTLRQKLKEAGLDLARPQKLICLSPGAGRKNKCWFNEYWANLAVMLLEKKGLSIIFTGTESELTVVDNILSKIPNKSKRLVNLCGKTYLQELFVLVNHSNLIIAPDSALIHIAKALSVPSIGLYGPVNPSIWGYNTKFHKSIFRKLECSFCDEGDCKIKTNKNKCMEWISPKDVLQTAETFI